MPRAKNSAASTVVVVNESAVSEANAASHAVAALDGAAADQALRHCEAFQLIGAMKATKSFADSLDAAHLRAFMKVRDEKLHMGLPYADENGAMRAITTLEDFCRVYMGISYDTMRERTGQLELLGESAYDGAMRLGVTIRQLRALKGGDTDVRQKVVAAIERGARGEVIELLDELLEDRREKAKALIEAEQQAEATHKVLDQKNRKIDQLTSDKLQKPQWHQQLEKAMASVDEVFSKLQLACAEAAALAETITDLEFEGVERESDLLALRAQVAVQFEGRSDFWLDQGVALLLAAREQQLEGMLSLAKRKLPDDVKAKLFGGEQ
jgi:hypothetical protein